MPFLEIAGKRLYFEFPVPRSSADQCVVYLHDGLGSTKSWKDIPLKIAKQLELDSLVYDRWGYGRSEPRFSFPLSYLEDEVPLLFQLLDQLSLGRVHLVGHSDGATIALLFASAYPERVQTVVAEAPHTFVEDRTREGIAGLLEESLGGPPRWLVKHQGGRAEAVLKAWAAQWLSRQRRVWDVRGQLAAITCPVLAIQGTEDEFATLKQVDAICREVRGATSWVAPGLGHSPHTEAKEEFIARLAFHIG